MTRQARRRIKFWFAAIVALVIGGCAGPSSHTQSPPATVSRVDLSRYAGSWYEIARYPNRFQEGCVATTATYRLREDGRIDVLNRCREESFSGSVKEARGVARVVEKETGAKLEVTFFWPFFGDYWIVGLDPDYRWALVGHPERRFLWLLSRTPRLPDETLNEILDELPPLGYDPRRLQFTPQP